MTCEDKARMCVVTWRSLPATKPFPIRRKLPDGENLANGCREAGYRWNKDGKQTTGMFMFLVDFRNSTFDPRLIPTGMKYQIQSTRALSHQTETSDGSEFAQNKES